MLLKKPYIDSNVSLWVTLIFKHNAYIRWLMVSFWWPSSQNQMVEVALIFTIYLFYNQYFSNKDNKYQAQICDTITHELPENNCITNGFHDDSAVLRETSVFNILQLVFHDLVWSKILCNMENERNQWPFNK